METGEWLSRAQALSNGDLVSKLDGLLRANRRTVAEVILHLGEVESRRLHLLAGHGSMFAYCVSRLGMSEDEACRRIEVARLARRFPRVYDALAAGGLSLSVAALLKPHLLEANHVALLAAVSGKTVAQSREILAAWSPQPDVPQSIRKLSTRHVVANPVGVTSPSPIVDTCGQPKMPPAVEPGGCAPAHAKLPAASHPRGAPPPPRAVSHSIQPLAPERYKVQLTAGAELKRKLELARDLLRHAIPNGDLAAIVERAVDLLIQHTMQRRFAVTSRPKASAKPSKPVSGCATPSSSDLRNLSNTPSSLPDQNSEPEKNNPAPVLDEPSSNSPTKQTAPTRHIPHAVRRSVLARDGARCTWQGPDGVRCNSRAWLERDHTQPRGLGGGNEPTNIRTLCRAHNRLAAEMAYGRDTISHIIANRQARRARRALAFEDDPARPRP